MGPVGMGWICGGGTVQNEIMAQIRDQWVPDLDLFSLENEPVSFRFIY